MRRLGTVTSHATRTILVDDEMANVMHHPVQTDSPDIGGRHHVFVTGRQATELFHFMQASQDEPLEITVLGWLHSQVDGAVVMAGRVIAVVPRAVRKLAVEARGQPPL